LPAAKDAESRKTNAGKKWRISRISFITRFGKEVSTVTPAKKIWEINALAITFVAVLYYLLIKKGRGIWPVEALATNNVN